MILNALGAYYGGGQAGFGGCLGPVTPLRIPWGVAFTVRVALVAPRTLAGSVVDLFRGAPPVNISDDSISAAMAVRECMESQTSRPPISVVGTKNRLVGTNVFDFQFADTAFRQKCAGLYYYDVMAIGLGGTGSRDEIVATSPLVLLASAGAPP